MVAFDATYFGDESGAGLFGLLQHTTRSRASDESVLICYPAPQETMRTYWAYKHLAHELARLGIQSLRFDYSGTGDSLGDSQGLNCERWQEEVSAKSHGVQQLSQPDISAVAGGTSSHEQHASFIGQNQWERKHKARQRHSGN